MKEAVVVTGATGILGRALMRRLSREGVPVFMLSRQPPAAGADYLSRPSCSEWLRADVSRPGLGLAARDYARLARQAGMIINLAARTDFSGLDVDAYRAVNIGGAENIFRFAVAAGAPLHHVSTAFVCGSFSGEFREDQLEVGQQFRNGYEESKYQAELLLRDLNDGAAGGIPLTVYRPSIIMERRPGKGAGAVFGPYLFLESVNRIRRFLQKKGGGVPQRPLRVDGGRRSSLPLVFDDEVAAVLWSLCRRPNPGCRTVHLVAPDGFANLLLEEVFNEVFGEAVACFADKDELVREPLSEVERILARKTAVYGQYLHLEVRFGRQHLEQLAGRGVLPTPRRQEIKEAFSLLLAGESGTA